MELDSPIKAGEYEISILQEDDEPKTQNGGSHDIKKARKWETISGGSEIDILETAMPNFAQGQFILILSFHWIKLKVITLSLVT